jgi:flagellar assembly protein FliH
MTQTSPFLFATEFSADGEVMSGPDRKYFSRDEAAQLAAKARAEGEARAKQATEAKAFASVDRIVVTLAPVAAQLSAVAEQLRAEAAELAMIAAKRIAGAALDRQGEEMAAAAIEDVLRQLKLNPAITVAITPDSIPAVERRREQRCQNVTIFNGRNEVGSLRCSRSKFLIEESRSKSQIFLRVPSGHMAGKTFGVEGA